MGQSCRAVPPDMTLNILVLLLFGVIHRGSSCTRRLPRITYHPVDGGAIAAQEEAHKQEMMQQATSTAASEPEDSTATCRVCSAEEQESARFFFQQSSEPDRQLPCCTEDEVTEGQDASETTECRQCSDEERRFPRFFFGSSSDERQVPCCTEDTKQDVATTTEETTADVSESCRQCSDEEARAGRFFFATQGIEDMNDLPCCNRKERRRLANATDCGQKPYHNRILGGIISKEHEFPWHCALLKKDGSFHGCGAVLLSCEPEIIIATAAHCFVRESNPENIMVSCGAHRVNANTPSPMDPDGVRLQATEVLRHENFRWLTAHTPILGENNGHPSGLGLFENDIAIVKVNGTLPCKKKEIWPACLPTPGTDYAGWAKTGLAGWGQTKRDGPVEPSHQLMKVNAPIVVDDYCEKKVCQVNIGPVGIQNCVITDTKICAGGVPDRGPCRGDSGGALVAQDNDLQGWSAVGLVSYQPGNVLEWPQCGSDKFTVFTEVSKYLGWIANQFNLDPPLS